MPDIPDTKPRPGLRHRTGPVVPAHREPAVAAREPETVGGPAEPRRRVLRSSRRRLVAMGLTGAASLLVVTILLQPGARPAEFRADAASPAVPEPSRPAGPTAGSATPSVDAAATTRPPEPLQRLSAAATLGTRPSPSATVHVTVVPAQQEGEVRSLVHDHGTAIQFVNGRDEPVVLYWLDYQGTRERYAVLGSGASRRQPTFVSHPWVITDLTGRALTIVLPASRPAQATIT
ncbi:hypothetical protein [Actinoplanes utahensis]|uniref:VHL beta domain-containing protein n=1 Tax=Actinoplanes utahensis TaxID=1869 RepID=UPI00126A6EFE|nr:hypothetical protein [Actinoplanes utahensis]